MAPISQDLAILLNGRSLSFIPDEELHLEKILSRSKALTILRSTYHGSPVAVRVISSGAWSPVLDALQETASAVAYCSNILSIKGVTVINNQIGIVTPLFPDNVSSLVRQKGGEGLHPHEALPVLRKVGQALSDLASDAGLVHGRLRPENVLIDGDQVALSDLGSLGALLSKSDAASDTSDADSDAFWAAPEQFEDAPGAVTAKADSWAFGLLATFLLTGSHPFPKDMTPQQVLVRLTLEKRPPEVPPGLPLPLGRLLVECLSIDPAARPDPGSIVERLRSVRREIESIPKPVSPAPAPLSPPTAPATPIILAPPPPAALAPEPEPEHPSSAASPPPPVAAGHPNFAAHAPALVKASLVGEGSALGFSAWLPAQDIAPAQGPFVVLANAPATKATVYDLSDKSGRSVTIKGHSELIRCAAFLRNPRYLITGSDDKTARVWEWGKNDCLGLLQGHMAPLTSVHASPHRDEWALSTAADRTARLWDYKKWSCVAMFQGHGGAVLSARMSPHDPTLVATASMDATCKLWDARVGKNTCSATLSGHAGPVTTVTFYPGGDSVLASGSVDGTVKIWDTRKHEVLAEVQTDCGPVSSAALLAQDLLLVGVHTGAFQLWDWRGLECRHHEHRDWSRCAAVAAAPGAAPAAGKAAPRGGGITAAVFGLTAEGEAAVDIVQIAV